MQLKFTFDQEQLNVNKKVFKNAQFWQTYTLVWHMVSINWNHLAFPKDKSIKHCFIVNFFFASCYSLVKQWKPKNKNWLWTSTSSAAGNLIFPVSFYRQGNEDFSVPSFMKILKAIDGKLKRFALTDCCLLQYLAAALDPHPFFWLVQTIVHLALKKCIG